MAHGGKIVGPGASQVLIEGQPAARVTDWVSCPLAPPAAPPPPHTGGNIIPPGAAMVLIEGQPAARVGDVAICAGGVPNAIVSGAADVEIGDG
jgi:uncharacterized Zn-binding protein involved in type VI secretion